ncbi:UNVERIFIED_CONTAM: hypothetical protein GTU68_024696 [Idotea baltica]|nr:hypothetical protein [Idotea baltica]
MVSRPSLAHDRLTPNNCEELLFDDVIWVEKAREDHAEFVRVMESRDIEVHDIQDLLAETIDQSAGARAFVLDRLITANAVGPGLAQAMRPWLDELSGAALARQLMGGVIVSDVPEGELTRLAKAELPGSEFLIPAVPNGPSSSANPSAGSTTCHPANPMLLARGGGPKRLFQRNGLQFHPMFMNAEFDILVWATSEREFPERHQWKSGDAMPIGTALFSSEMASGTTTQAVTQVRIEPVCLGGTERV